MAANESFLNVDLEDITRHRDSIIHPPSSSSPSTESGGANDANNAHQNDAQKAANNVVGEEGQKKKKKKKKKKNKTDVKPESSDDEQDEEEEEEQEPAIDESWRTYVPVPPEGGADDEKQIVKDTDWDARKVKKDETWYILSARWFASWKNYVNYDGYNIEGPRPGPIVNEGLIRQGTVDYVRKDFTEGTHYEILPEDVWKLLYTWYGGGPPLPRHVIPAGYGDKWAVEVRPLCLKVVKSSDQATEEGVMVSKAMPVGEFIKKMCRRMRLKVKNVRAWDWHQRNKIKWLQNMNESLGEAQIIDNQLVLLEEKDPKTGQWPQASQGYGRYNSMYSEPSEPGLVGLSNLGNTCFMNSSLQCLSNAAPLANFFLTEKYKSDVNPSNPLGMKGELAEEYANLMKELWSGRYRATAPRDFKYKLEHFAPQFSGYQQHDSQELLGFLLDGLHEDLNRIIKKPYVESKDGNGRPDEEVAAEAWQGHKARNDSVIVDWFQGQLKSTLVCPICAKVSITFDPVMYLSLPLPMKMTRRIQATISWKDPMRLPMTLAVTVPKYGTIAEFRKAIADLVKLPEETLVLTSVAEHRFTGELKNSGQIDEIHDRDTICIYEVPTDSEVPNFSAPRGPPPPVPARPPDLGARLAAKQAAQASGETEAEEGKDDAEGEPAEMEEDKEKHEFDKGKDKDDKDDKDDLFTSSSSDDEYGENWSVSNWYSNKKKAPPKPSLPADAVINICVVNRKEEIIHYQSYLRHMTTYTKKSLFGYPFVLTVRRNITYKQLYRLLLEKMQRFVRPPAPIPEPEQTEEQPEEQQADVAASDDQPEGEATPGAATENVEQEGEAHHDRDASSTNVADNVVADNTEHASGSAEHTGEGEGEAAEGDASDNDSSSSYLSSSSSDEEEEPEAEQEDPLLAPIDGRYPLFVIKATDVYGTYEQGAPIYNNDEPLMLEPKQTIALCWDGEALKNGVYDEEEEDKADTHESAQPVLDSKPEKQVTLQDCIELFTQVEKLGPDDPWYCSKCQEFRQATKKFDLWKLPNILVVHLKRFSYKNRYWREKLETYVDYPEYDLDLSPFIQNKTDVSPVYDLYAVSNHYGSLGGGHYTAYAKNHRNNKWYSFDDSSVSEANKIHSSAAYVLFYKRKDVDATAWTALSADEAKNLTRGAAGEAADPSNTAGDNDDDDDTSSSSYTSSSEDDEESDAEPRAEHHASDADDDGDNEGDVEMSDLGAHQVSLSRLL